MNEKLAKLDCLGMLRDLARDGFGLVQRYEQYVRRHAGLETANPGLVTLSAKGFDLLGDHASYWNNQISSQTYLGLRSHLEREKKNDTAFPGRDVACDTKKEARALYELSAAALGVTKVRGSGNSTDFIATASSGTMILRFDGGGRRYLSGALPIYYYFSTTNRPELFLGNLSWISPAVEEYFRFGAITARPDGLMNVETSGASALHGINASLAALQALANNIVK